MSSIARCREGRLGKFTRPKDQWAGRERARYAKTRNVIGGGSAAQQTRLLRGLFSGGLNVPSFGKLSVRQRKG